MAKSCSDDCVRFMRDTDGIAACSKGYDIKAALGLPCGSFIHDEADPEGLDQHAPGAKLDAGKRRPALVLKGFSRALMRVADVGTYGAIKYSDNGWQDVKDGENRYEDAAMRHWLKAAAGEEIDPDTGIEHAAHEAWNKLAKLEFLLRRKGWMGVLLLMLISTPAQADWYERRAQMLNHSIEQSHRALDLLETEKQARERHSAERFRYNQRLGNPAGAPLGGYYEQLGRPAPVGTLNPGYRFNKGEYYD